MTIAAIDLTRFGQRAMVVRVSKIDGLVGGGRWWIAGRSTMAAGGIVETTWTIGLSPALKIAAVASNCSTGGPIEIVGKPLMVIYYVRPG